MADKRFLRSTINFNATASSALTGGSATMRLFRFPNSTADYEATKQQSQFTGTGNFAVNFEIGELAEDFLDIDFNGTYTSQSIRYTADIKFYDSSGAQSGGTTTLDFYGVSGYTEFQEGADVVVTGTPPAISTRTLYLPENTIGYVPTFSATGFTYNSFSANATTKTVSGVVWNIERFCTPKYTPYKVTFVNKFGALEDLYFLLVRRDTTNITYEKFKRNIVSSTGSYNIYDHQTTTFNHNGNDTFVMNTPYVKEEYNQTLEELMLSEKIWITENGQVVPIICTTKGLEKKTHVNDKLIQYEVSFQYAFDKINKIR
jgi:hypothetical protein